MIVGFSASLLSISKFGIGFLAGEVAQNVLTKSIFGYILRFQIGGVLD